MADYNKFRQETKKKKEDHRRQQAETAAFLRKQMEFKRVQKQMWHNSSMAADDVLMDGDRKRQL